MAAVVDCDYDCDCCRADDAQWPLDTPLDRFERVGGALEISGLARRQRRQRPPPPQQLADAHCEVATEQRHRQLVAGCAPDDHLAVGRYSVAIARGCGRGVGFVASFPFDWPRMRGSRIVDRFALDFAEGGVGGIAFVGARLPVPVEESCDWWAVVVVAAPLSLGH